MENIDDTNIEEESQVEEQALTTEETIQEETVENYSEKLEEAETEEEAIAAFNQAAGDTPTNIGEEASAELDTEAEPSSDYIFDLKDGDIKLSLNTQDENERKQAIRLMQQGLNYAGKTTELAKHKSFVNYAEENGVSLEDIQLLSAAKRGDKNAIAQISKTANVDVFDLDNDMAEEYKADPIEMTQQTDPMIDSIATEILAVDEHRDAFQKWFPTMPDDIQAAVMGNSQVLHGVQEDMQAGVFEPAMEQAYKYQKLQGLDFGSAYTRAKQEYLAINQPDPVPEITRGDRRRASAPRSGGGGGQRSTGYAPGAISDMNDEEFLADYNKIIASVRAG